jgi:tetratricopeptide (TPR) repeat protein/energy-coupling factor transporter ATP-binding protein EcfA2
MATQNGFVGRHAELEQFKKVLEDPKGEAVLVVGQAGMGKTWLVNRMATIAENHPDLKCGCVRYEVTPTDSVDSTMALMMDNAFEAGSVTEGSFDGTTRRLEQWRSFLNVFNMGDLVMSLRRDPAQNTREQFLERLRLISKRMAKNRRAIFIIDPEKYMQKESDQSWAIVARELPDRVKFIFAQRPEDVLVGSETFGALKNVVRIPDKRLDVLSDEDVHDLVVAHSSELSCSMGDLEKVLRRYKGHPYAVGAAIELVKAGVALKDLPKRPEPIEFAKKQWEKVCDRSENAIRLFKAYAVLDVGVPDDVVEHVGKLDSDKRQHLSVDKYLLGLLREEGHGKRIYHAILADYVLDQIGEAQKKEYHARAVEVYRGKLKKAREDKSRPDELAATRLAQHVLQAEGPAAFVETLVNECTQPLKSLGLLDAAIYLSELARGMVKRGSEEEAVVTGNLGLIYRTRGELDKAEQMFRKALEVAEKLGMQEIMANQYGNLGVIYQMRGDLDKAEQMHRKSLEIAGKLGLQEGMASQYGNLGLIYRDRGDLDKAEQMHRKSLEIEERLGRLEGMASDYGNLGLIYRTRGELDKAEQMHRKSLEIAEKLGLQEIMASQYGNLGLIHRARGDLDRAEPMHRKSLEISERLGWLEGMANDYGNLGTIYQTRGDLDKAEQMFEKVLKIEENLGRPDSIANAYGNLGLLYEQRGDAAKAREYWSKSLELYKRIGMPQMVEKVEGLLRETGN